jgi:hypothetical protein
MGILLLFFKHNWVDLAKGSLLLIEEYAFSSWSDIISLNSISAELS